MKVILFGSTGMVGKSVLRQCLLDPDVESVLLIGRNPSGVSHPKLRDLVHADMFDFNVNAAMRFLYVSGMGTGGKAMWARVKGRTENDLLALFPAAIMIRLGALRPMHGERSKAPGGDVLLTVLSPLWPVLQWLWPSGVITTEELGRAMILAVRSGGSKRVLESADLVALGRSDTAGMKAQLGRDA